ncbi:hypothetical protein CONPUDRAFT_165618, partial [Coniophora puteana RWD-64-598 SS2]
MGLPEKLDLSSEACDALCRCPVPILFRKLRSLQLALCDIAQSQLIGAILLGPQLRYLKVRDMSPLQDVLLRGAPKLAMACPLIKTIECPDSNFPYKRTRSEPPLATSATICSLKHLVSVNCGLVDEYMLTHLRRLPSLWSLT